MRKRGIEVLGDLGADDIHREKQQRDGKERASRNRKEWGAFIGIHICAVP